MTYKINVVTKDKIRASKWSGGITNEIYIYPEGASYKERNFSWRISSATVELDHSTFTDLPGIKRFITTLKGDMKLVHDNGPEIELKPFKIHDFDGGAKTESYGRVTDFNLMIGNGAKGVLDVLAMVPGYSYDMPLEIVNDKSSNFGRYCIAFYAPKGFTNINVDEEKYALEEGEALILELSKGDKLPKITISSLKIVELLVSIIAMES